MAYRTYSPSNGFLVNPGGQGDFTSITATLAVATSGVVVYLAPGTYNESFTVPSGVSISTLPGSGDFGAVIINGTITFSAAGKYTLSNIQIQSTSTYGIVVSGNGAINLNVEGCSLLCNGFTFINYSNSNASSNIDFHNCIGDIAVIGAAHINMSSPGGMIFNYCLMENSSGSSVANIQSAGSLYFAYSAFSSPLTTNGTASVQFYYSSVGYGSATNLTIGGSGINSLYYSQVFSGNAIGITATSIIAVQNLEMYCTGSAAITGTGILQLGEITFTGSTTAITINTVQLAFQTDIGDLHVYRGGNLVIETGSMVTVQSGATLNLQAGSAVDVPLTGILIGHGAGNGVTASAITQYDILVGGASNAVSSVGPGTAGQLLQSGGNAANPAYTSATYPSTATTGDIIIATGTNALGSLAAVATHQVLASAGTGTAPAYTAYPQISGLGIGASAGSTAGLTFDGTNFMTAYSTGTFSPTIDGSVSGSTTYSSQTGFYTIIGNRVFVDASIIITAATGTGNVVLGGFPATIKNTTHYLPIGAFRLNASWSWPASTTQAVIQGLLNTTTANVLCFGNNVAASNMQMTNAAGTFVYSFCYQM